MRLYRIAKALEDLGLALERKLHRFAGIFMDRPGQLLPSRDRLAVDGRDLVVDGQPGQVRRAHGEGKEGGQENRHEDGQESREEDSQESGTEGPNDQG